MALHAGVTDERMGDYYGPPVNRVARLLATVWGGEVVVSAYAAELLAGCLPDDASLRDLGWHRLKDLEQPEHVFQVVAPGLQSDFEPLRSLSAGTNNLPAQTTGFIGREDDVAQIERLFQASRLVSIAGVGGVGKTRVALQAAANMLYGFRDGAWFVNLAPISDAALVPSTILSALRVTRSSDRPALEILLEYVRDRALLLVIDNCEHLIEEVASVVTSVIAAAPNVKVLATTREALNVTGEHIYRLPPLPLDEAVQLFITRARAAKADFSVSAETLRKIEEICRRVDGIALAIELAAPRVRVLSVDELCERLNERFRILTGGSRTALPRQQTMRALIDWSHDLLSEEERRIFRRLAIFAGTFTLDAVGDVCGDDDIHDSEALDILGVLVDKSLVVADVGERQSRYHLLQSIQAYAHERLDEANECEAISGRHASYFARFAEDSFTEWDTDPRPTWLSLGAAELDNIRAALSWSLWERKATDTGTRLIANAFPIFLRLSLLREFIDWAERALSEELKIESSVEARLQYGLSMVYNNQAALANAIICAERAATLYEVVGDSRGLASAYSQLAQQYGRQEKNDKALSYVPRAMSLARESGDSRLLATTLQRCGVALPNEQIEQSRAYFREAVSLFRVLGRDEDTGRALGWWGSAEAAAGCVDRAMTISLEALDLVSGDTKPFLGLYVAEYALLQSDMEQALSRARTALAMAKDVHHPVLSSIAIAFIAAAISEDEPQRAGRLLAFSRSRYVAGEWPPGNYSPVVFGNLEESLNRTLTAEQRAQCTNDAAGWSDDLAFSEAMGV
jgi:predicted ATPase